MGLFFAQTTPPAFDVTVTTAHVGTLVTNGIQQAATERSTLAASGFRLDLVAANLDTQTTNLDSAISRIRDVDVATETTRLAKATYWHRRALRSSRRPIRFRNRCSGFGSSLRYVASGFVADVELIFIQLVAERPDADLEHIGSSCTIASSGFEGAQDVLLSTSCRESVGLDFGREGSCGSCFASPSA